ncbi:MAG: hypothetical protein K2P69_10740 [Eubacterium sp.]|nr:hypothetical protein [Eubacterium sp.]
MADSVKEQNYFLNMPSNVTGKVAKHKIKELLSSGKHDVAYNERYQPATRAYKEYLPISKERINTTNMEGYSKKRIRVRNHRERN